MSIRTPDYTYSEPDYPDEFVKYIGSGTQISLAMQPSELPGILEDKISKRKNIIPELEGVIAKRGEKLTDNQIRIINELHTLNENNIYPFLGLEFSATLHDPKLIYIGPKWREMNGWGMDELHKFCINPVHLSKNKKWYYLYFKEFKDEPVKNLKKSVEEFRNQGYKITSITTELNPRIVTRDHYSDEFESDLTIIIKNGGINLYGVKNQNFKFPTTKKDLADFFE